MARFLVGKMPVINPMNLKWYRGIGKIPATNPTMGGLHLEDIASRISVWLTYYLPQGTLAILTMQRPFETWGRNMSAWLGTFAVAYVAKDQNMGVNGFLDLMMAPKGSKFPVKIPKGFKDKLYLFRKNPKVLLNHIFSPLLEKFRPNYNYIELFEKAGGDLASFGIKGDLKKAVYENPIWAKFDVNELKMFEARKKHLAQKIAQETQHLATLAGEARSPFLKSITNRKSELKAINALTKRLSKFKYVSVGVFILLASYFIGITVQKLVFRFIAPIDKKLGLDLKKPDKKKHAQAEQPPTRHGVHGFAGNLPTPQTVRVVPQQTMMPFQQAFPPGYGVYFNGGQRAW